MEERPTLEVLLAPDCNPGHRLAIELHTLQTRPPSSPQAPGTPLDLPRGGLWPGHASSYLAFLPQ